jgi:hypothetical protein
MNGFLPQPGLRGRRAGAPLEGLCRRSSARRDCISGGWHQYRLGWPTVLPQTAAMRSALATRSLDPRFQPRVRLRSGHGLINLVSESALMFLKIAARPLLALRSINGGFRLSFRCSIQLDRCLIDHLDATVRARDPHSPRVRQTAALAVR